MNHTQTIAGLEKVLASTYMLYVKTQSAHWNYEGAHFPSYHAFFEEQYNELRDAVDELAERIRQLGSPAIGTMASFIAKSVLTEQEGIASTEMVATLAKDHKAIRDLLETLIQDQGIDEGTRDMLIARQQAHDKHHWMLKATSK